MLHVCVCVFCVCVERETQTGRHREEGMDILKEEKETKEYGQMKKANGIMLIMGESG